MAETNFNLGYLFSGHGKLALAEEMYERALRGRKAAIGAEHTSMLKENSVWELVMIFLATLNRCIDLHRTSGRSIAPQFSL